MILGLTIIRLAIVLSCFICGLAYAEETLPLQTRGILSPQNSAVLSSKMEGRIIRLPFKDGQAFKKGDLLVAFDCNLLKTREESAAADLARARLIVESNQRLLQMNSIGQFEVAIAEVDVRKAKAELLTTQVMVRLCSTYAPFSGRMVDVYSHPYESVASGHKLMEILDDSSLEIELVVPSKWLSWLHPGKQFSFTLDETNRQITGSVARIGARIDPVSQSATVKATIKKSKKPSEDGLLLAGMSGTAIFPPLPPLPLAVLAPSTSLLEKSPP